MIERQAPIEPTTWNKILERRRKLLDLTQVQAADAIGVPLGTYGRWERGSNKPMPVYRRMIAEAFSMEEDEIFTD